MSSEQSEKYKAFLSSLYEELKEEELLEAEVAEEENTVFFEKAIARPDTTIRFPNKNLLKKTETGVIHRMYTYAAPAMSIAAMLLIAFLMQSQLPKSGSSFRRNNENDKMQPNFPVMESPLNAGIINTNVHFATPVNGRPGNSNNSASGKIQNTNASLNPEEIASSRMQVENALKLMRNSTQEYKTAFGSAPATDEYISSLVFRHKQGFGQAEARIFLDDPLAQPTAKIGDKDLSVHHSFNNINANAENAYSLHLSLARW